jgi:hypothetical protein
VGKSTRDYLFGSGYARYGQCKVPHVNAREALAYAILISILDCWVIMLVCQLVPLIATFFGLAEFCC